MDWILMAATAVAMFAAWRSYYEKVQVRRDLVSALRITNHLASVITSISVFSALDSGHMRLINRTSLKIQEDATLNRLLEKYAPEIALTEEEKLGVYE